jgi:hypothetical protein
MLFFLAPLLFLVLLLIFFVDFFVTHEQDSFEFAAK